MKTQKKSINTNTVLLMVLSLLAVIIMIYIGFSIYFKNHFLFGTYINDVNYSGKTMKETEQAITNRINGYVLTLEERGDIKEYIASNDIDLKAVLNSNLDEVKKKQNPYLWIASLFSEKKYNIGVTASYDENLLANVFNNLQCFNTEKVEKPVNAQISEYTEDNGYQIIEAKQGNEVDKEKLYNLVKDAIQVQEPKISLEETNSYVKPKYTSESKKVQKALDKLNKYINITITYEFGDVKEVVDANDISEWLVVTKDYNVKLDKEKVRKFVDYLGYTYNTFGKKREFKTSYGKTVKVIGGDYGWWLNRSAEVDELITVVKNGKSLTKEPNYYQKAASFGADDIGSTYVEINLKTQHLFYYKEGKLVIESDFVSGNVSKGFGTPVGTYSITYKEHDATLVGENYETPVKYWMPFNNNIGLHDANWRTSFGGEIYLTRGSHGCINLPPKVAQKIFDNIAKGTPVVVYELDLYNGKKDNQDNITDNTNVTSEDSNAVNDNINDSDNNNE